MEKNKARTNKEYLEELKKIHVFFMERVEITHSGNEKETILRSTNPEIQYNNNKEGKIIDYGLFVIEEIIKQEESTDDNIEFSFHEADGNNKDDWKRIIDSFSYRKHIAEDKFNFIYLLWFLNHTSWEKKHDKFGRTQLQNAIINYSDSQTQKNILNDLSQCCRCLSYNKQQQIKAFLSDYTIYSFSLIYDALNHIKPSITIEKIKDKNIFELADYIFLNQADDRNTPNRIIHVKKWLQSCHPLNDYNNLPEVYSVVSEKTQLDIIKRYFYDVKLNNTKFDINLIEQFKNTPYENFIRYRHCCMEPGKIKMGNKLLCDCILTLIKTKGQSFQEFDGILDLIITNCDVINPNYIDLMMDTFLPCCKGGVVNNTNFKGFISYNIIYQLDKKMFEKKFSNISSSYEKRKEYIGDIKSIQEKLGIDDKKTDLLRNCCIPIKIKVSPNENAYKYVEYKKGIDYKEWEKLKDEEKRQTKEILQSTINSLNIFFKDKNCRFTKNGSSFEFEYDKKLLNELKGFYYYNKEGEDNNFLTHRDIRKRILFCSPKIASEYNKVLDKPFYFCMNRHCFEPVFYTQTLQEVYSWNNYTLFHLCEIIGYPQTNKAKYGYESNETIIKFIVIANKVVRKFKQLKCRKCGHLLYKVTKRHLNSYNYFSCINPNCSEYNKEIYLNYCYHCKKGLIDSRDDKQCENGFYICPECASCCDDEIFELKANQYINHNRPIPDYIEQKRGHGHNNKGIYFCPKCGTQLKLNGEQNIFICPNCENTVAPTNKNIQ